MITATEAALLRDILEGERGRTERTAETDAALIGLLKAGLVRYRKERPAQKFNVTQQGRDALTAYDAAQPKPSALESWWHDAVAAVERTGK